MFYILADVFESFREVSYDNYGLDPCWYYSAPGLSWDALLKFSKVRLELLTDVDMFNFIEKGIRGGISVITKKYAEANNKYLKKYDPKLPSKYIVNLDFNNLYGSSMIEPMPLGGFYWITADRFLFETEKKIPEDVSYFVEVHLDYPTSLHKLHNDYPVCAESMVIDYSLLSKEQQELASPRQHSIVKKLVPNLLDKRNYVLHYKALKQAVDAGLVLRKVHRVLKFNQSPWMRGYINLNTSRRAAAKTNFEKDFFKLMNNAVFGKTMENIRKRVNIELVNDVNRRNKLVSDDDFVSMKIFNENLVAIQRRKTNLKLTKPIYVGASVLDLSKWLMYDFHYNFVKNQWQASRLLFTGY